MTLKHSRMVQIASASTILLLLLVLLLLLPAISVSGDENSWQDDFDSLDTDIWGTDTSGNGTVGVSGDNLVITSNATTDAGIAYLKTKISQTDKQLYALGYVSNVPDDDLYFFQLQNYAASTPAVDVAATVNGYLRAGVSTHNNGGDLECTIFYVDSGSTTQYWTGDNWTTSYTALDSVTGGDEHYVYLETDDTGNFRVMITNSADTRYVAISDWVAFSDTKSPNSDIYLVIGDPYTNWSSGDLSIDYFRYYASRAYFGLFNGSGMYGFNPNYCVFRANIYQESFGTDAIPWLDAMIDIGDLPGGIGAGSGYELVKDPCIVTYNGTDYVFVSTLNGTAYDTWYFTTADEGDNITRPQDTPIISHGGAGWRQNSVIFPVVARDEDESDSSKRWKMFVAGSDAGGIWSVGYYYASDPPGAGDWTWTEYGSNPIIERTDSAGYWNRYGILPDSITSDGTDLYLYVGGKIDTGAAERWVGGLYTASPSDWTDWTEYGGNPIISQDAGAVETLTANLNSGATSVVVADSSDFSAGDVVLVYDDGDAVNYTFCLDRVKAIPDGTHITLEKGADRNYTTGNGAMILGIEYQSLIPGASLLSPSRYLYATPFTHTLIDFSNYALTEMSALYTSTDDSDWSIDMSESPIIPMGGDSDALFYRSAENLAVPQSITLSSPPVTTTAPATTTTPQSSDAGTTLLQSALRTVLATAIIIGVFLSAKSGRLGLLSVVVGVFTFVMVDILIGML